MINQQKNFCYRIYHIDNLKHILNNGLCTKHHPNARADFVSIGNTEIIDTRNNTVVKIKNYGKIGEYVPFYFTPRSLMLLNIVTGHRAPLVPKRNKDELVVVRCLIDDLCKLNKFFFTDGQANIISMTEHYNDIALLDTIDWGIIQNSDFKKDADDTDKQRRYQAEFLVYSHVPVTAIESIVVYNEKAEKLVKTELAKTDKIIPIHIIKNYFFD